MILGKSNNGKQWALIGLGMVLTISIIALLYLQIKKQNKLKSDIASVDQQLSSLNQRFQKNESIGVSFGSIDEIYKFIEENARGSRMTIIRLVIPEPKSDTRQVPVELVVAGNYPDLIRYFSRLQSNSGLFEVQTLNIVSSQHSGATIQANLKLKFSLDQGGAK